MRNFPLTVVDFSMDYEGLDFLCFTYSKLLSRSQVEAAELNWPLTTKSQRLSSQKSTGKNHATTESSYPQTFEINWPNDSRLFCIKL